MKLYTEEQVKKLLALQNMEIMNVNKLLMN